MKEGAEEGEMVLLFFFSLWPQRERTANHRMIAKMSFPSLFYGAGLMGSFFLSVYLSVPIVSSSSSSFFFFTVFLLPISLLAGQSLTGHFGEVGQVPASGLRSLVSDSRSPLPPPVVAFQCRQG